MTPVQGYCEEGIGQQEGSLLGPQNNVDTATKALILGPQRIGVGN
jgi:hypothetical protein